MAPISWTTAHETSESRHVPTEEVGHLEEEIEGPTVFDRVHCLTTDLVLLGAAPQCSRRVERDEHCHASHKQRRNGLIGRRGRIIRLRGLFWFQ